MIGMRASCHECDDDPERAALEAQAERLGVRVRLCGACYEEWRLAELLMASNVSLVPGKIGLTSIHSLAYGTPVTTHGDPCVQMPEWEVLIPGRTGDFFAPGDVEDLARVIKRWASTTYAEEESVRAACCSLVERFYTSAFQRRAIEWMLDGNPADDLSWMRGAARMDTGES